MLAHAHTASSAGFPARARRAAVVLQLFPKLAMNRPAEVAQMDALLGRVAATQDRAAFAALFAHFAPRVKAYLLRLGAPSGVAEELAQEALLSVWRKAHLFDPAKASAATWRMNPFCQAPCLLPQRSRSLEAAKAPFACSRMPWRAG